MEWTVSAQPKITKLAHLDLECVPPLMQIYTSRSKPFTYKHFAILYKLELNKTEFLEPILVKVFFKLNFDSN